MTLSRAPARLSGRRRSSRTRNCPLWLNDAAGCAALQPTQTSAGRAGTCIDLSCSHSVCRLSRGTDWLFHCSMVTGHLALCLGVGSCLIKVTSSISSHFKQRQRGTEGLVAALTRDFEALQRIVQPHFNGLVHCYQHAAVLTVILLEPTWCWS